MDEHTRWAIDMLTVMQNEQKAIFQKYSGRVINPDGSDEYKEAKKKFDRADRMIKMLDVEIAQLLTQQEQPKRSFLEELVENFKKLLKDDDPGPSVATGVR